MRSKLKQQQLWAYMLCVTVLFTVGMEFDSRNNYSDPPSMKINSNEQIANFNMKSSLTQPAAESIPFIPIHGYAASYYLNVRTNTNVTSRIINIVKHGDILEVLETTDNDWLKLKSGGYVNAKYVALISGINAAVPSKPSTTVKSDSKLSEEHIAQILEGTLLADHGLEKTILEIEQDYGINAYFTIAVMKIESGHGKSKIAKEKNNLFGLNAIDSDAYNKAYSFKTMGESVLKFGQLISEHYIDKGYTSVEKVASKYCKANPKWSALVMSIMKGDYKKLQ